LKLEADITCPSCKRKFKQRIEDMRPGNGRPCPGCGVDIRFEGDDGHRAQRALDDLQKSLKKLGGTG